MTLYIKVTESCNLHCPFCYIKQKPGTIDMDSIDRAMQELQPNRIIFHGGEPLLYPKIILETIKQYPDIEYSVTSNLMVPLTDQVLEVIKRCKIATSYSVDRFTEEQFEDFKAAVKMVSSYQPITLLVTLSEAQLQQPPKILSDTIKELEISNITFERLFTERKSKELYEQTDEYLLEAFKHVDTEKNNMLHWMEDAIRSNGTVFNHDCDVQTLNPDGSLCGCPNLYRTRIHDQRKRECLYCDIYQYCKEDCPSFGGICCFPKKTFQSILKASVNK